MQRLWATAAVRRMAKNMVHDYVELDADMTQEVLPGGYWLTAVLFDDFIPVARPTLARARAEVPANKPPEFPLSAPGEIPPPAPQEEPSRTPQEMPARPHARRRAVCA
jgi:hypothetical protein